MFSYIQFYAHVHVIYVVQITVSQQCTITVYYYSAVYIVVYVHVGWALFRTVLGWQDGIESPLSLVYMPVVLAHPGFTAKAWQDVL